MGHTGVPTFHLLAQPRNLSFQFALHRFILPYVIARTRSVYLLSPSWTNAPLTPTHPQYTCRPTRAMSELDGIESFQGGIFDPDALEDLRRGMTHHTWERPTTEDGSGPLYQGGDPETTKMLREQTMGYLEKFEAEVERVAESRFYTEDPQVCEELTEKLTSHGSSEFLADKALLCARKLFGQDMSSALERTRIRDMGGLVSFIEGPISLGFALGENDKAKVDECVNDGKTMDWVSLEEEEGTRTRENVCSRMLQVLRSDGQNDRQDLTVPTNVGPAPEP